MRFVHVADVHLGAAPDSEFPWSREREEEIWESFRRLIGQLRHDKPELLLIAGDLFHRQPMKREVSEINYLFSTIPDTEVVMIAGNHDYIRPDSWYLRCRWADNVHGLWERDCHEIYLSKIDTNVTGFSYHSREIRTAEYDGLRADGEASFQVLLAHGGDEKHIPIHREELISAGYDYIALGHIHKPQELIKNRIRYAGSLEPLDRTETGSHGFVVGSFENGRVYTEFVPWAVRSYVPLTVETDASATQFELEENIQQMISRKGEQNLFLLRLCGIRDPQTEFRQTRLMELGNILEVIDETRPDYDLQSLKRRYEGSLIEKYIRRFEYSRNSVEEKALHYGLEALLGAGGQE